MEFELGAWILQPEVWLTCLLNAIALLAVWVPLRRGLSLYARARQATERGETKAHARAGEAASGSADSNPGIAQIFEGVLNESMRENGEARHPVAFLRDAARQYAENEYNSSYAQPISMYANILPPIGFIGTTAGLMALFVSMRMSSDALELGGLALALSSTLFALIGYATLEGLKIRLYRRLLLCLDDVTQSSSVSSPQSASAVPATTSPVLT